MELSRLPLATVAVPCSLRLRLVEERRQPRADVLVGGLPFDDADGTEDRKTIRGIRIETDFERAVTSRKRHPDRPPHLSTRTPRRRARLFLSIIDFSLLHRHILKNLVLGLPPAFQKKSAAQRRPQRGKATSTAPRRPYRSRLHTFGPQGRPSLRDRKSSSRNALGRARQVAEPVPTPGRDHRAHMRADQLRASVRKNRFLAKRDKQQAAAKRSQPDDLKDEPPWWARSRTPSGRR
jgi:hypothetical protein